VYVAALSNEKFPELLDDVPLCVNALPPVALTAAAACPKTALLKPNGIYAPCYAYALAQLPKKLVPSLKIVTTSMAPAAVDSAEYVPANLTAAEPSVPKLAVRDPVPSCVMIIVTDCPVPKFAMLNPVLVPSVTVCTGANPQSTVIVDELVNELIFSLYLSSEPTLDLAVSSSE
tara:strand:- start:18 stop:539 length:522 start_codon:yes stop_codon:yes gene_type:complete